MSREQCLEMLVRKLSDYAELSEAAVAAIDALPCTIRTVEPSGYIVREGDVPTACAIVLSGFAFRQKLSGDGARQILSLRIPGDLLDAQTLFLSAVDHNVQALTRAKIGLIPRSAIQQLMDAHPSAAHAITVDILIEASITREWLLNVGRRNALARLAHLLCEFTVRMDSRGLGVDGAYELPLTQEQLGDALGLTSVHVNRTLKALEAEGVLKRQGRRISFTGWREARRIADFSPAYLHLPDTRSEMVKS